MIFLDADGVFVDLHGPLLKIHGFDMSKWIPGEYQIERVYDCTAAALWTHPDVLHPDFWAELPKTPWADELMKVVLNKTDDVCFLTKPVRDHNCSSGKARWFKKHYPKIDFLIGSTKKYCASPGKYLIDDFDYNVEEFTRHGGLGILFPRIWNKLHTVTDPIRHVERMLNAAA